MVKFELWLKKFCYKNLYVRPVGSQYNMGFVPSIGEVPYYLAFGQDPVLFVDLWDMAQVDLMSNAAKTVKSKVLTRVKRAEELVTSFMAKSSGCSRSNTMELQTTRCPC